MAKIKVLSFSQIGKLIVSKRIANAKRNKKKSPVTPKKKKPKKQRVKKSIRNLPIVENSHFKNYKDYCKSQYFKRLKGTVLKKANYVCAKCGGRAKTAHHEVYRDRWSESRVSDCIAICNICHTEIHTGKPIELINRTKNTAINTKESNSLDVLFSKYA